jgi:hypothetical protein
MHLISCGRPREWRKGPFTPSFSGWLARAALGCLLFHAGFLHTAGSHSSYVVHSVSPRRRSSNNVCAIRFTAVCGRANGIHRGKGLRSSLRHQPQHGRLLQ